MSIQGGAQALVLMKVHPGCAPHLPLTICPRGLGESQGTPGWPQQAGTESVPLLSPFVPQLDIVEFIPSLLYFGYTALMVLSFWLLTGTIGFYAAYMFVRKIYAAVKID